MTIAQAPYLSAAVSKTFITSTTVDVVFNGSNFTPNHTLLNSNGDELTELNGGYTITGKVFTTTSMTFTISVGASAIASNDAITLSNHSSPHGQDYKITFETIELNIGTEAYGGVIVSLNGDKTEGLVASKATIGPHAWGCYDAGGITLGDSGSDNTDNLVDLGYCATPAASAAAGYTVNVDGVDYSDWFLPSKQELQHLLTNIVVLDTPELLGGFYDYGTQYNTWTSSMESSVLTAYSTWPSNTPNQRIPQILVRNRTESYLVRPFRAFTVTP